MQPETTHSYVWSITILLATISIFLSNHKSKEKLPYLLPAICYTCNKWTNRVGYMTWNQWCPWLYFCVWWPDKNSSVGPMSDVWAPLLRVYYISSTISQIARFMEPIWGPSGADRAQVGPMLVPWTLLSGILLGFVWFIIRGFSFLCKNNYCFLSVRRKQRHCQ